MDAGQAFGVAVAGSAVMSGIVIGAGELYRALAYPESRQRGKAVPEEDSGDEEG